MVANETLGHANSDLSGKDDNRKMLLTKVRYINKKESVMCFCHLDGEDPLDQETSTSPEGGSESDSETCKTSDSDSFTDGKTMSPCQGMLSKRKAKVKRKSVRFQVQNNFDVSSTASEPVQSIHTVGDLPVGSSFLPPIDNATDYAVKGYSDTKSSRDDSHIKESKAQLRWASRRHPAVPEKLFKTLNSLSLSPRVTRKMSMETLHDIKKTIAESREHIKKSGVSNSHTKRIHQRGLQSIPEAGLTKSRRSVVPRRLVPVDSPLAKSPLSVLNLETESEQGRLDFIKRALSPMPEGAAIEAFRNRAATISGGEKRSWLMKRRNSREGIWLRKHTGNVTQDSTEDTPQTEFTAIDLSRL